METVALEQDSLAEQGSTVSAALLIAGTSIGAGMLALPVVTGLAGFIPAIVVSSLCWLFMLATGLLMVEATLWMPEGANILSMAERFLGRYGKIAGGSAFLFLYYCLLVAYVAGGAPLLSNALGLDSLWGVSLFATSFGLLVYSGTHIIGRLNTLFMASLILSYFLLIGLGSAEVSLTLLSTQNWKLSLLATPILFSAFGYHNVIPTMATYLKRDAKKLRIAVIVGATIPFVVYSLWQWMMIGSIPQGMLAKAASEGVPVTAILQQVTGSSWVSWLGAYFGFFALVTSFLSVSLSMVDFLGDGLKVKREGISRLCLCLATFLPPSVLAIYYPAVFISALEYAGGFGEAILNGFFPVAMVWIGRYKLALGGDSQVPFGRVALSILMLVTVAMVAYEVFHLFGG